MKKSLLTLVTASTLTLGFAGQAFAKSYDVEKGDSLWQIAQDNHTTVKELADLNDLNTTVIQPGQQIKIDNKEVYTIKPGDTLSEIAKQYKVSVDDLKKWNNLETDLIFIGDQLTINTDATVQSDEKAEAAAEKPTPEAAPKKADPAPNRAPKAAQPKKEKADQPAPKPVSHKTSTKAHSGQKITVEATGYTANCEGCSGITATGVNLNSNPDAKVIAVDPSVIPLGTKVYVPGYGTAVAADTGGAINGNRIDINFATRDQALQFGRKNVTITILK